MKIKILTRKSEEIEVNYEILSLEFGEVVTHEDIYVRVPNPKFDSLVDDEEYQFIETTFPRLLDKPLIPVTCQIKVDDNDCLKLGDIVFDGTINYRYLGDGILDCSNYMVEKYNSPTFFIIAGGAYSESSSIH